MSRDISSRGSTRASPHARQLTAGQKGPARELANNVYRGDRPRPRRMASPSATSYSDASRSTRGSLACEVTCDAASTARRTQRDTNRRSSVEFSAPPQNPMIQPIVALYTCTLGTRIPVASAETPCALTIEGGGLRVKTATSATTAIKAAKIFQWFASTNRRVLTSKMIFSGSSSP
jgi:hypothetical protein